MNREGWGRSGEVAASQVPGALAPLERALRDHHEGRRPALLTVRYDTGEEELLDAGLFFRVVGRPPPGRAGGGGGRAPATGSRAPGPHAESAGAGSSVEAVALRAAEGRVLDVGAGVGAATLPLQEAGHEVTALEVLPAAVEILRERGGIDVRRADVWTVDLDSRYDTVLALMNGTGLAGGLGRLPALLERLSSFLAPGGRILLDSADVRGGVRPGEEGVDEEPVDHGGDLPDGRYAGEVQIQLEYDGLRGEPFPHLYVHEELLAEVAAGAGLRCHVLARDEMGRYLARLTGQQAVGVRPRRTASWPERRSLV